MTTIKQKKKNMNFQTFHSTEQNKTLDLFRFNNGTNSKQALSLIILNK